MVIMYADLKEYKSGYSFSLPSYSLLKFVKLRAAVRVTIMFVTTRNEKIPYNCSRTIPCFHLWTLLFLIYQMWMAVSANGKKLSLRQSPILGLRVCPSSEFSFSSTSVFIEKSPVALKSWAAKRIRRDKEMVSRSSCCHSESHLWILADKIHREKA